MTTLKLAQSIWLADAYTPSTEFLSVCKNTFNASIHSYKFGDEKLAENINSWCSENTGGYIKNLVEQNEVSESVFNILGATAFYGQWYKKFNQPTTEEPFYTSSGNPRMIMMMKDNGDYYISTTDKVSMLEKVFGNGSFVIGFLLPHDNITIDEAIKSLNSDAWLSLTDNNNSNRYDVTLYAPRLTLQTDYNFLPYYSELGIKTALTENADFSNITGNNSGISLQLSRQKAQFEMNEDGATAVAAQTESTGFTDAGPNWTEKKDFKLNRPFAFVIYEQSTKSILFLGKVELP